MDYILLICISCYIFSKKEQEMGKSMITGSCIPGAMKRYIVLSIVMVAGVSIGIYALIQMGYWEGEMARCYKAAKDAESQGLKDQADEYYAQLDQAFKNRLIWGSIGTSGVVAGVGSLLWIFLLLVRGETPDPDRIKRKKETKVVDNGQEKG